MYSLERRSKFCNFLELHSNIRNNPNFDSFDFVLFGIDQVTATVTLPWNVPRRLKLVFRSGEGNSASTPEEKVTAEQYFGTKFLKTFWNSKNGIEFCSNFARICK